MRKLLCLFLSLIALEITAQLETYNFQDFRQGEFNLSILEFTPSLAGSHSKRHENNFNSRNIVTSNNGSSSINLDYFNTSNNHLKQENKRLLFYIAPSYDNSTVEGQEKESSASMEVALSGNIDQKRFVGYNKWFWGFQGRTFTRFTRQTRKDKNQPSFTQKDHALTTNNSFGLQIGWGRIENITNAWHGARIVNRFLFTEIMKEDVSHELLNILGQEIDVIKAERIFDSRLGFMTQMMMLDVFIKDELGVTREDLKYFLELNDMWRFGISENRIKGGQFNINPGVTFDYSYNKGKVNSSIDSLDRDTDNKFNAFGPTLNLVYTYGLPIKQLYQFNATLQLSTHLEDRNVAINAIDIHTENFSLTPQMNFFLGYYPTTRTELGINFNTSYAFETTKHDDSFGPDETTISRFGLELSLNGQQFITWRTRFTYGFSFTNREFVRDDGFNKFTDRVDYHFRYHFGFRHALF